MVIGKEEWNHALPIQTFELSYQMLKKRPLFKKVFNGMFKNPKHFPGLSKGERGQGYLHIMRCSAQLAMYPLGSGTSCSVLAFPSQVFTFMLT